MMKVQYRPTLDDVLRAYDEMMRPDRLLLILLGLLGRPWRAKRLTAWLAGVLVVGGVTVFAAAGVYLAAHVHSMWLGVEVLPAMFVAMMFTGNFGRTRRQVVAEFEAGSWGRTDVTIAADDAGVRVNGEHWRNEMAWSTLKAVTETRNVLLITDDELLSHMVPKRAFARADDVATFRDFVRARISSRKE